MKQSNYVENGEVTVTVSLVLLFHINKHLAFLNLQVQARERWEKERFSSIDC